MMSTLANSGKLGRIARLAEADLDKCGWTELQHIQYMIGIWDGIEGHSVLHRELPKRDWVQNDDWKKLRGILSDHPEHDTTAQRKADREWELEHERQKFGG